MDQRTIRRNHRRLINLRCGAKSTQTKKQNGPHTQDDCASADSFAGECRSDLTEPSEYVEACSDTGLGTGSGDTNLLKDNSVCS
jgi:hypothetical protein